MPEYEDFEEFTRAVFNELPDEWKTYGEDALHADTTDEPGGKASVERDDLIGVVMEYTTNETWQPDELLVQVAQDDMTIPDRPNANVVRESLPVDASAVARFIRENAPEYDGPFEYDDE